MYKSCIIQQTQTCSFYESAQFTLQKPSSNFSTTYKNGVQFTNIQTCLFYESAKFTKVHNLQKVLLMLNFEDKHDTIVVKICTTTESSSSLRYQCAARGAELLAVIRCTTSKAAQRGPGRGLRKDGFALTLRSQWIVRGLWRLS